MTTEPKPLTAAEASAISSRIVELDRLYLLAEAHDNAYLQALGAADLDAATRAKGLQRSYRRAYEQLRDSNIGLPEGYTR